MGVSALDVAIFVAELAGYTAVAVAAGQHHVLLGAAAVVVMAVWWGLLHSPRARLRLPRGVDLPLRALWFGIGVGCAVVVLRG